MDCPARLTLNVLVRTWFHVQANSSGSKPLPRIMIGAVKDTKGESYALRISLAYHGCLCSGDQSPPTAGQSGRGPHDDQPGECKTHRIDIPCLFEVSNFILSCSKFCFGCSSLDEYVQGLSDTQFSSHTSLEIAWREWPVMPSSLAGLCLLLICGECASPPVWLSVSDNRWRAI
jgi:hypothetical protein